MHNAEIASKRLDDRQKRRQVLQGRKLGNTKLIERLEAKKTTEGLTEEENQKLQKVKRKVREAERQIPEVRGVIEDLKKFISEETTKSNTQQKASLDKLGDLYYLLTEREALVDSFNNLQKNPEKLEESLSKDLNDAVNSYNKRKSFKLYNSIKKSRNLRQDILKSILEGKTNFDTLISIAEEQKDDKFKNEVKTLKELNDVAIEIYGLFESEETQIPINETTKPYISAIQNQLAKTIWNSPTAKDARQNVEDVLDAMIDNPNKIISDLATIIKKEYTDNKKDNQGTSKNKKRGSSKSKKSEVSDAVQEMIAKENYEDIIREMTREELEEFINSDGGLLDYLTEDDIELSDYEDENLAEEVINYLDSLEETEDSDTKSNFSKGAEEDEDEDEDDESDEDEDEDEDTVTSKDEIFASDSSKNKKSGRGLSSKTKILPPSEVPKDQKKIIVGDNNEGSESNLKASDITDAWHGNRNSSKYVINDLKKGKLTVNDWFWYNNYLNQEGINHQEFIDSGELQRLKEYYESIGEKCPIRFVKIKYKREDGHLFAELRDNEWWEEYKKVYADGLYKDESLVKFKNIVLNNTVFLAVEKPDGFDAKDGTFETFVNTSEGNKKVQLIGVADSLSKDVRELINSEVKDLTGHIRMANVSSTLEWVFSGRLVKETETIEKDEKDLRDIVNEDSAEGVLQIEIITPSDNITIGEDLEGEVVPLNIHRENIPITNKSDRYGTIWIKTKEADGRIYYKGVKIKAFDSSYTDTDSKIYKAIKKAVKAIVVAEDKNTAQNALNDLKRHLYFEGKTFPIFKNVKDDTLTFNDDNTTIDLSGDVNEAVDAVMEAIQSRGYTFAVGLNGFSLDDVIQSNILSTDLAQLHNSNSSFIFSKIEVDESGDWWVTPSEQIPTKLGEEIHLGEKGLQDKKGYVNRVKLNGTFYSQRTDGTWAKYEGGEYISVEDELNANDKFRLQLLADIKNEKIKPSGWYPRKKGKVTVKVPVYTRENPNKASTLEYVDKDGNFLTQEQIKAYNDLKSTRNEDKKKAARKKLDTIGKNKKTTTRKTKKSNEGEEKTTVESVPLPSGKNTKSSSIELFETEDGFETIIKRRNGKTQEGKYIRTEDEDGFIKYTLDGSYTTGVKVTAETLGLTIDELIGGRDSFNSQDGYESAVEEYKDGAVVMQIVIRPDGTYSVSTDVEGLGVEGEAAERVYEKFKEWAKPKKRQPAAPEGIKPEGKRGRVPGQDFKKLSSGNPIIDNIVDTLPKVSRQWLIDNKLNKQTLSSILKDLLDNKKISSDMLSEVLSSLYTRNVDKTNSLLDNIMKCR